MNDKHWIEIRSGADPKLAARAAERAFEIPSYRYDALFRPLEQLLVSKPTPAPKSAGAKAPASKSPGKTPQTHESHTAPGSASAPPP